MRQLIPAYIQQQLLAGRENGQITAFALNIDLSGFTQLTNDLMRQGSQGAEAMSVILNEIFGPLVSLVYKRGGIIPYFAGDAFTAVFPLPADPMHAMHLLHTAAEAREIFPQRDHQFGGQYTIGIKAGLAQGTVEYGIVGDDRKAFYFRGPTIDGAANCQSLANDQDIVVDGFTRNLISNRPITLEELSPEAYLVRGKISGEAATVHPLELPPLQKEIAKSFLPKGIERINQVGEFRTVITVFIAFSNIDTHEEMASFAKIILEKADNFGGYFKEIDFGDKGGLIPIFFGAPISYENSVVRAIEFALSIREEVDILCKDHPDIQYRMGITMGTAFTGYVGGQERCQYACVGTRTNLAARIMMHADWQEILVDDEIAHTSLFRFKPKGKTKYKGISEPIPTFVLLGRQHQAGKPGYTGPMIAREAECRTLREFAMPIFRNETAGLAYVYGEAGIGKSRTLHELRRQLSAQYRLSWQLCPSDQILRKPFNSFIYFLKQYFHQSIDLDVEQ
ncbi:MAG: adenylate/guanylate cyclase domain-containing protein, partial [Bacteroidota bacterium]